MIFGKVLKFGEERYIFFLDNSEIDQFIEEL